MDRKVEGAKRRAELSSRVEKKVLWICIYVSPVEVIHRACDVRNPVQGGVQVTRIPQEMYGGRRMVEQGWLGLWSVSLFVCSYCVGNSVQSVAPWSFFLNRLG